MSSAFRQSSWIVTLSLAAIAVVYMTIVWMPGRKAILEMQSQIDAKRTFLTQSTTQSAALLGIQKELDRTKTVVTQWENAAPKKKNLAKLFGTIDSLAKDAHLAVSRFDPQPFVLHEKLREIPLAIKCSGSFAEIFNFIRQVESLPVALWVDSLRIERPSQDGKNTECEVSLVVFSNNS